VQEKAVAEAAGPVLSVEHGLKVMHRTRSFIIAAWRALQMKSRASGDHDLAQDISEFVDAMSPIQTEHATHVQRARNAAKSQSKAPEYFH
jgi:hypothetical protein